MNRIEMECGNWFAAPNSVFDREDLDTYDKLLLIYFYRRANAEAQSFPGLTRAAKDIGCTKPRVIKSVATLERLGLLTVERKKRPDGGDAPNLYTLPCKSRILGASISRIPPGVSDDDTKNTHIEQNPSCNNTRVHREKKTTSRALLSHAAGLWVGKMGGAFSYPRCGAAFKRLAGMYTEEQIAAGWENYLRVTDAQYVSYEGFASRAGLFMPKPEKAAAGVDVQDMFGGGLT
jgi:hypothetical protein